MGLKEIYDGEDYHKCNFCQGEGKVPDEKVDYYDPIGDELLFNDDMED